MSARDLDITIGLTNIGRVRERPGGKVEAFDSAGRPLGAFPSIEKGRLAVWQNWQERTGGADASAS